MLNDGISREEATWKRHWNMDRLRLMVREPTSLFLYWEVSALKRQMVCEHFQCNWDHLPLHLQLHDVTDVFFPIQPAHSTVTLPVHPSSDNWYFHDVAPARRYLAQLCTTTRNGRFFALLQSNVVATPRLAASSAEPSVGFRAVPSTASPIVDDSSPAASVQPFTSYSTVFDGYSVIRDAEASN
ncbi:hypothetical protein GCM10025857_24890 [Alicyclobacillus contaminans]|uniref:DUF4912 domain-containing protein n=1 Tax=Alicyclobacillus contaminans TaxID=392016 RepID=UPI000410CFC2|nr:DUF4912 domain-containing protein [Alicyclobacillus contaminans]GMA51132.1 hypothetical protein GCM10025857_24890 [Alicyclobacillus contaminans]